ncbi:MAG: hypothetical protein CVV49_20255 [Spirochaetae bacterium HGW-Spirochaetae-5]|nr:MAG: hypothetical protein CVV49_20255 [Spirochaetae bacterium HGW-Spirochaetae-5]
MKKKLWIIFFLIITVMAAAAASVYIQFAAVTEGEPIPEYSVNNPALLVIDIQEGLSGSSSWGFYKGYAHQSEELIASVNRTIESAVMSGMTVVYICHEDTNPLVKLVTGSHMVKGKAASAIDKRVKIVSDNIFIKHIMDGFSNEALHKFLTANKINTLYMTGLDAEYCVYRTSLAAEKRGYTVNLIEDAVISSTVENKFNMLKKYKSKGINIIKAEDFKSLSHAVINKN